MGAILRLLSFLLLFQTYAVYGQLQGIVVDASSKTPLPFANVVTNTGITAISGYSGDFLLQGLTSSDTSVLITYIGYQTQGARIDSISFLYISLVPQSVPLNEITVTSGIAANHLKSITGHINVLDDGELNLRRHENVATYLNTLPGIYMASGSTNTNKLSIRGIGSRTLYGTNRIKMYLNDIPVTSADGITAPEDIDVNSIVRMEVLKGPSSALYGSGLGGSVHMYTSKAVAEGVDYKYSVQYGSFGQMNISPGITYTKGAIQLHGNFTYAAADGYRQNSAYKRKSGLFTATYTRNQNFVSATFAITDNYSRIPSSVDYETYRDTPERAAANWLNIRGYEDYTRIAAGITYRKLFAGSFKTKTTVFSNYSDGYERRPFNILDDDMLSGGLRAYIEYSNNRFSSIAGTEYMLESYRWKIRETQALLQGALLAKYTERRSSADFFQLNTFKPNNHVSFEFGMNINLLRYKLTDQFADSVDDSGSFSYSPEFSPKAGINYSLNQNSNLYFSVSRGFSPPTVEETLLPEGTINPDLKPETGWNIELGTRGQLLTQSFYYDISVYQIMLRNLLVNKRVTEDIFTGINAGKTSHYGLEVNLNYQLRPDTVRNRFQLSAATSFWTSLNKFDEFTDDGKDYANNHLPGIPSYSYYARLRMEFRFHAGIEAEYRHLGKQFMNDANTATYTNYGLLSLNLFYKRLIRNKHTAIFFVSIENLLNTRYASMILVNAPSFGANQPRYYYPGYPRQFKVGVRITRAIL